MVKIYIKPYDKISIIIDILDGNNLIHGYNRCDDGYYDVFFNNTINIPKSLYPFMKDIKNVNTANKKIRQFLKEGG